LEDSGHAISGEAQALKEVVADLILLERERIKRQTIANRGLQHQLCAA
jgi:hypothetical protein